MQTREHIEAAALGAGPIGLAEIQLEVLLDIRDLLVETRGDTRDRLSDILSAVIDVETAVQETSKAVTTYGR